MDDLFYRDTDGIYRCLPFQQFAWQSHGFGTRHANPSPDVTLRQIHSAIVRNAHALKDRELDGDALVTNDCAVSIGIRTADCVPILLLDAKRQAVAAVHAGWRGTAEEVVRSAIHKMFSDFGSSPSDIWAAIGPCIRECCYEVGPEVASRFEGVFPEWGQVTGKRNLNLPEANVRQMGAAGVPPGQIFDSHLCTACRIDTFHSFRREPQNPGRLISAIARIS